MKALLFLGLILLLSGCIEQQQLIGTPGCIEFNAVYDAEIDMCVVEDVPIIILDERTCLESKDINTLTVDRYEMHVTCGYYKENGYVVPYWEKERRDSEHSIVYIDNCLYQKDNDSLEDVDKFIDDCNNGVFLEQGFDWSCGNFEIIEKIYKEEKLCLEWSK